MTNAPPDFDSTFRDQLAELIRWRRDVRRFLPTEVAPDVLSRLLDLANLAPSVGLSQPWRFVEVVTRERREAIRGCFEHCNAEALADQTASRAALYARLKLAGLDEAPCHLAVFSEQSPQQGHGLGRKTMPETTLYSTVMAVHTLWLAARAEGLGLGWVSILEPREVCVILDIPETWTFVGYFCVGFPQAETLAPELQNLGWEARRPVSGMRFTR